jgi:hypothetical protein
MRPAGSLPLEVGYDGPQEHRTSAVPARKGDDARSRLTFPERGNGPAVTPPKQPRQRPITRPHVDRGVGPRSPGCFSRRAMMRLTPGGATRTSLGLHRSSTGSGFSRLAPRHPLHPHRVRSRCRSGDTVWHIHIC